MLNLINFQKKPLTTSELRRKLPRGGVDVDAVLPTVTPVITAIRDHGVSAALDYGEQFDHVRPESLQVPSAVIDQAVADLDPDLRAALEESIARVRAVHADQKPQPHTTELTTGGTVTEIFQPIARVGLYVPGGNAVYPSSVIMNVVPAQEAGRPTTTVGPTPPFSQLAASSASPKCGLWAAPRPSHSWPTATPTSNPST